MTKKVKSRRSGAKIMARLIVLLGSLAYIMLLAVINGCIGNLCAMGVTVFASIGIAKALGETINMSYGLIIGLAIGCGALRGILRYFEQYSNHYIAFRLLAVLRDKIFGALRILCPAKLENKKKGSIISMITSDIETLEVFYAHTISPICIAIVVSLVVLLFVGLTSSFYLSAVALVGYLLIGIVVPLLSSAKLKDDGVKYRSEFSSFSAYFLDSIRGIKDIVLNNGSKKRQEVVNEKSTILLKETKKMKHNITKFQALIELMVSLFIILTLAVGIVLVRNDMLSIGKMIIGVVCVFSSFGPIIAVASLPGNLTNTFASGDRVLNLLEEKPLVLDIKDKNDFKYDNLIVSNLNFAYENNQNVLNDINMAVNKGEIVGIIGASGSGKSTLLNLLLRFFEANNDSIKYNDLSINEINTKSLHENVTMVSQSTYLFNETIMDNLLIAKENATKEEVINACKMASIHDFITSLPDGYNTLVSALGDNLSAGEKQRLGLARALLRGSDLILLDEPTSNVDSINEGIILKSLKEQKNKKGIILVSHRESTMSIASRIYKIENGRMVEVR